MGDRDKARARARARARAMVAIQWRLTERWPGKGEDKAGLGSRQKRDLPNTGLLKGNKKARYRHNTTEHRLAERKKVKSKGDYLTVI